MLYVYYGTDRLAVRNTATNYIETNRSADDTVTTLDAQSFTPGQITNALGAVSLFGGTQWFVIDSPATEPDMDEEVKQHLKEMSQSVTVFIVLEGALLAPVKKNYAKYATSAPQEFMVGKATTFNAFLLADALANKDRRKLWVLLQEARLNEQSPEAIIGILWWQLKSLQLAHATRTATEAGMKEFPYSKAKRALTKFSSGEVTQLSYSLLRLYHDGHAGVQDIDLALERWVLRGR